MNDEKDLVVDANILMRGALGEGVGRLIRLYQDTVTFFTPEICVFDARRSVTDVMKRFGSDPAPALQKLNWLIGIMRIVEHRHYQRYEERASARIRSRDITDWPIVATSLLLNAPLWTEDQDFFGCGIATWTTINIELYLRAPITS